MEDGDLHRPPTLVFACGNPSRGDDALGPELLRVLEQSCASGELSGIELLTDFQLQVEHALDLSEWSVVRAVGSAARTFHLTSVVGTVKTSRTSRNLHSISESEEFRQD